MIHSSLIKNNECMTYQFMKVFGNLKYQYFSFVNVVTMPTIDSNILKLLYLNLYVINNQSEIEINWDRCEIKTNLQSQSFDCSTKQYMNHILGIFLMADLKDVTTKLEKLEKNLQTQKFSRIIRLHWGHGFIIYLPKSLK